MYIFVALTTALDPVGIAGVIFCFVTFAAFVPNVHPVNPLVKFGCDTKFGRVSGCATRPDGAGISGVLCRGRPGSR